MKKGFILVKNNLFNSVTIEVTLKNDRNRSTRWKTVITLIKKNMYKNCFKKYLPKHESFYFDKSRRARDKLLKYDHFFNQKVIYIFITLQNQLL